MDEALARWLRLREAADAAARVDELTRAIAAAVHASAGDGRAARVLDLATGAGSNVRYLIPRLPSSQRWLAVDRSGALLQQLIIRTAVWASERGHEVETSSTGLSIHGAPIACEVTTQAADLDLLDDPALFADRHLVTASALLDLASATWLDRLAGHCRDAGAHALLTLTYNGASSCTPVEPEDEEVRGLLNRHQRRDKGLGGPAAGPGAADEARRAFSEAGFEVRSAASDWALGVGDEEMQHELIGGWADAATQLVPDRAGVIDDWRGRRLAHVDHGRSRIHVGHVDLAALHPGR